MNPTIIFQALGEPTMIKKEKSNLRKVHHPVTWKTKEVRCTSNKSKENIS
jgi:hypothetical protein